MGLPSRPPPGLSGKILRGADAVRSGLLTTEDLRGPAWRQVFRGVYADANSPDPHRQRCLAAAWYVLPPRAAIAGRSAAWLYGVRVVREDDPVEVVVPWSDRIGPVNGLTVHVADLPDSDVRVIDGARRTSPVRTCWDLVRWLALPDAVAYLDMLAARGQVTLRALEAYARERAGQRGWRGLLRAVALADPAAATARESRLRVRLVLAGLPKPVSQYEIAKGGASAGRLALAWPRQRVAIQYDEPAGAGHDPAEAPRVGSYDGWIILSPTTGRLRGDFTGFVAEVGAALRSRHAPSYFDPER